MKNSATTETKILKRGARNYFFDIRESAKGNKYLRITESWLNTETKENKRNSLTLFKEDLDQFKKMLEEIKLE